MIPLLAQLGIALVASKMQKDDAERAYQHARGQQLANVQQDIAARRAARAGDSGYMQAALGGIAGGPKRDRGAAARTLMGVGSALLAQRPEPSTPAPDAGWSNDTFKDGGWSGGNLYDEDKFGGYA